MSAIQMKLGRSRLRSGDLNVVSVIFGTRREILTDARKSVMLGVRLAEFRADLSLNTAQGDFSKIVSTLEELRAECPSLSIIGTIRQFVQYGSYRGTESDRLHAFEKLIPFLDAIDIELVAKQIQKKVIDLAKEQNKTVIVSHHAIFDMPSVKQLGRWAAVASKLKPDFVKLSLKGQTPQDLERLLIFTKQFVSERPTPALVTLLVGEPKLALASRIACPLAGSALTYGVPRRSFLSRTLGIPSIKELLSARELRHEFSQAIAIA